jgi:hypothetical protein
MLAIMIDALRRFQPASASVRVRPLGSKSDPVYQMPYQSRAGMTLYLQDAYKLLKP